MKAAELRQIRLLRMIVIVNRARRKKQAKHPPDINSYFKEAPQVELNNAVEYYNTTLYTMSTSLSSPALNSNWNQEDLDSRDSIICEGEFINN
jgi:hypothetical protein